MMKVKYMAGVAIVAIAISSCDEDTLTIGQSLTAESDKIELFTASFPVSTQTTVADSVLTLSSTCYLGKVKDPETETNVTSEFTTQFHVLENTILTEEKKIIARSEGRASADSCDILLFLKSPFLPADSLTAMKMRIHELIQPIEEGKYYYSNFDPVANHLLRNDEGAINTSKMFTYMNLNDSDAYRASTSYQANIRIPLSRPYTAMDGTRYNNYGTYLMHQYYDHPQYFKNSYSFAHNVCPGFFFEIADGLGFHAQVSNMGLCVYYTADVDSVVNRVMLFAGTQEVLQTTKVTNDRDAISKLAAETTHTYLKSPAGLFTQVSLPVDEIKDYIDKNGTKHTEDSLLAAKLTFQRINNESFDERALGIPQSLLLVQQDSLSAFFEKNKVPDNKTSYYTVYNSSYNTYTFTNLAALVTELWNQKQSGLKGDPSWVEKHPNWNKMLLVPVSYSTSQSDGSITNIAHDMSLTSTRLVGGADNPHSPIEINIVYARFNERK